MWLKVVRCVQCVVMCVVNQWVGVAREELLRWGIAQLEVRADTKYKQLTFDIGCADRRAVG